MDQSLRDAFLEQGYVALPSFLQRPDIEVLIDNVDRYIRDVVPQMPREQVFYEDKSDPSTLKQLQRMFGHDAFFHNLMFGSRFQQLAAVLLGQDVRGVNLQYFNKPPGIGKPTPAHQDGFYFMLQPNEAVTMWLALEQVDEENGCVRYVPGSHRRGLRAHDRTQTLGFSQGLEFTAEDRQQEVAITAQPGDLLAHHALTIHRADGNRSTTRTRRALGFIYYATAARESAEKDRRHQALLAELRQTGQV